MLWKANFLELAKINKQKNLFGLRKSCVGALLRQRV